MDQKNQPMRIVFTGDFGNQEFAFAIQPFEANEDQESNIRFVDWKQVLDLSSSSVDLIVIAQSRRGQFSQESFDRLIQEYPLAAKVVLFGGWCEGETRSGTPMQGIHRIYVRDWPSAFQRNGQQWKATGVCEWNYPSSVSETDTLLEYSIAETSGSNPNITIFAKSSTTAFQDAIEEFCESRHWKFCALNEFATSQSAKVGAGQSVLLVECYYSINEAIEFHREYCKANSLTNTPLIACCGFPRSQDRAALRSAVRFGELIGKPFDNRNLESSIDRLLSAAAATASSPELKLAGGEDISELDFNSKSKSRKASA